MDIFSWMAAVERKEKMYGWHYTFYPA